MDNNLEKLHQLVNEGRFIESQDVFRELLSNVSTTNDVLYRAYFLKAYEINSKKDHPFGGLTSKQLEAHSIIVRQLLIDNSEELDRRLSRVL